MKYNASLDTLKGIGKKTKDLFGALDINDVGALLYDFPRAYLTYPRPVKELDEYVGQKIAVECMLKAGVAVRKTSKMDISIASVNYHGARLEFIWFRQPYIRSTIKASNTYVFYGVLKTNGSRGYQIQQPEVFKKADYDRMIVRPQPVYSLTKGLSNKVVKKAVAQVVEDPFLTKEYLPDELVKKNGLATLPYALRQIHQPDDFRSLAEANDRLVYNEFLDFFLASYAENIAGEEAENCFEFTKMDVYEDTRKKLPFELTPGQESTLEKIITDMKGERVTQRLIQGDVGSGKTIVAFLAMLLCVENGYQAAIMAPTEVLARQHEKTFCDLIESFGLPYEVVCVTGSLTAAKRRAANERLANENSLFIVGTHALLSEGMEYKDLAMVVTDEQHRFGVKQRKLLSQKGDSPFMLVMSATPIPRTLAMILYGGMNISVIKDVPKKRLRIKNSVVKRNKRTAAWKFIGGEIEKGRQAYIICPRVEQTETSEAENVTDYSEEVRGYFGGRVNVGMLHGRMKPAEKDAIMEDFAANRIQILVSTTVVEVGINVPNATVMLIEDANRFGLAQLHQLRGRVGRGEWQSYCIFMDSSDGEKEQERLKILEKSNDGFYIASEDLKLRGPGDFYGVRQSGDMDFKLADIYRDADIMKMASEDAEAIMAEDPELKTEKNAALKKHQRQRGETAYTNL